MYLDLVYQWRQLADEFEALERAKGKETGTKPSPPPADVSDR
jgi:hypothetical protein